MFSGLYTAALLSGSLSSVAGAVLLERRLRGGAGRVVRLVPSCVAARVVVKRPRPSVEVAPEIPAFYSVRRIRGGSDPHPYYVDLGTGGSDVNLPWYPAQYRFPSGVVAVHPTVIAQRGLDDFTRFTRTGSLAARERAKSAASWLIAAQRADGSWRIPSAWQEMPADWASAMLQGQAMSLLCRFLNSDSLGEVAYAAAVRGFDFMMRAAREGGTVGEFPDGAPSLEEYPHARHTRHVLNGAIFALMGIRDLWLMGEHQHAAVAWEVYSDSLAAHLSAYDNGHWSRYALPSNGIVLPARVHYHLMHIAQLRALSQVSERNEWSRTANKWEAYYLEWRREERPARRTLPAQHQLQPASKEVS